jgi:hypothetical protein
LLTRAGQKGNFGEDKTRIVEKRTLRHRAQGAYGLQLSSHGQSSLTHERSQWNRRCHDKKTASGLKDDSCCCLPLLEYNLGLV